MPLPIKSSGGLSFSMKDTIPVYGWQMFHKAVEKISY